MKIEVLYHLSFNTEVLKSGTDSRNTSIASVLTQVTQVLNDIIDSGAIMSPYNFNTGDKGILIKGMDSRDNSISSHN